MYGSIEELNNIDNALQHINNKFFLTIDLKNFFGNITHTQINEVFTVNNFPCKEARILTKLTTYKGQLPQGAPTSPVLANLAFAKTALQLQAFIEKQNITFTTFLDDLAFSSLKDFKFLIPDLLKIIRDNKFYPHHKKIHYRTDKCEITGLIVGNGKLRLTDEMQREALRNPRIMAYAQTVKKQYDEYVKGIRKKKKVKSKKQNHFNELHLYHNLSIKNHCRSDSSTKA
jgi:RNA-directed DNA polymerase